MPAAGTDRTLCPLITPVPSNPSTLATTHRPAYIPRSPDPTTLAYSFTVPGDPRSATVVRATIRSVLRTHGLTAIEEAALSVAGELVACGTRFAPGQDLYHSLRWCDGALRIVNWDAHHAHSDTRQAAHCTACRKRTLLLLAAVIHECRGTWGISEPGSTSEGTRVWARIPVPGA
ncbi:ATP-binding protein [Streptomyces rectiverticillatus]|uniref:ATP-binding protein n=1 Tax=Streptomyces rectiverticillatus TaxID=173860 RepID=UPI0015C37A01|nr:ATP-binding protein [Streptomyces rectiverticillatus]QLE73758.1 ATP-binding protein [Streptomyces rectiverticillatus]